jgi:rhamnosyltransferase subunit B
MRMILNPFGSAEDTRPFLAIGRALKARGHEVLVLANAEFAEAVQAAGLRFFANGTAEQQRAITADPDLAHPERGLKVLLERGAGPLMRPHLEMLRGLVVQGQTVLVTSALAMAPRLAREKLGPKGAVPLVTVHRSPSVFYSVYRSPRFPRVLLPEGMPTPIKSLVFRLRDALLDRSIRPQLDAVRKEMALKPVRRVFKDWVHSPDALLCLWPDWFAPPQPDWPKHAKLAGFPMLDDAEGRPPMPALEAWLDAGPPPLLFASGPTHLASRDFFWAAVCAARELKRRALLVSPSMALSAVTATDIHHVEDVPLSRVLPRVEAFIGHGGIDSCAYGLAAGVPQLVTPRAYDEFDNGSRLVDLGVGDLLPARRWNIKRATEVLARLLANQELARACRHVRETVAREDSLSAACDVIEGARVAQP